MRPSRRLCGVVLLLLSTSGCAAVQSRMNGPTRDPEDQPPSRSSGWFGSKFWSRPTPTSASSAAGTQVTPDVETARPTTPETDIWPGPKSSGLSRLFPMLGSRDGGQRTATAGDVYPTLASLSGSAATPLASNDRQVKTASGDEPPEQAATRRQAARTRAASPAQTYDPEVLPSPIAVRVPARLHERPASRGTVALEVEPADLYEGNESARGESSRNFAAGPTLELPEIGQPRRASLPATGHGVRPTSSRPLPAWPTWRVPAGTKLLSRPHPARCPLGQCEPAAQGPFSEAPANGSLDDAIHGSSASSPRAHDTIHGPSPPPLEPTTAPAPATGSIPAPTTPPSQSPPPAATAPAPAPAAAPAPAPEPVPPPESVPTAEPGPKPAPSTPGSVPPVAAMPGPAPVPTSQSLAPAAAPAPFAAATGQGNATRAQAAPSPQAIGSAGSPAKPPHKTCWLLDWVHSLHKPASPPPSNCQLPPVTFPTAYKTYTVASRPTGQSVAGCVQPTPQSPQAFTPPPCVCTCPKKAPKASCFSWFHYGMASDFFAKVRSWRHGCACRCHDSEFRLWRGECKRCASKCGGPAPPTASPQAISSPAPQSQSGLSSWSPVPSDLAEGSQVLDRIASQGLDKTP